MISDDLKKVSLKHFLIFSKQLKLTKNDKKLRKSKNYWNYLFESHAQKVKLS